MTDRDVVAARLAFIETCVQELREMAEPGLLASESKSPSRNNMPAAAATSGHLAAYVLASGSDR